MSASEHLPGFWQKRKMLFGPKTTPQTMLETGERFFEAGRLDDALEFFARATASEEVRQIVRMAQERGDTALFLRAKRVLKEEPTDEELVAIARVAEAAGYKFMAYVALLKAGHQEEADRLRAELAAQDGPASDVASVSPAGSAGAKPQSSL